MRPCGFRGDRTCGIRCHGRDGRVANAAQDLPITGCSINDAVAGVQIIAACVASDGAICNATEIKATVDQTFLQEFPGKPGSGVRVPRDLESDPGHPTGARSACATARITPKANTR